MTDTYFVTGTDTGVGKTLVAAALLHAARARGLRTIGLKPVASGCEREGGALRNADALALLAETSEPLTYEDVNPIALEPAIAPHLAARDVGRPLVAAELIAHCRRQLQRDQDFALVEGAGGWRVPLDAPDTLADVARGLDLPVILVVGIRLGCINHALLTAEAVRADGLRLAGWVGNHVDPLAARSEDIVQTLAARLHAPCLGRIGHLVPPGIEQAARQLDLAALLCKS